MKPQTSMVYFLSSLQLVGRLCGLAMLAVALGTSLLAQESQTQAPDSAPEAADPPAGGGGVRARTRLVQRSATVVTEEQASELTLTLTVAAPRPIQTWVRTAGVLDDAGRVLTADVRSPAAQLVAVGQRVRTFSLNSRSQMLQAKVTRVTPRD